MKAKCCGGVPTDTSTPRLILLLDKVTLPIGTGIGDGAQSVALERAADEQTTSHTIQYHQGPALEGRGGILDRKCTDLRKDRDENGVEPEETKRGTEIIPNGRCGKENFIHLS